MAKIKKKYKYTHTFSVANYWSWHKVVNIFSTYGRVKRIGKNKFTINTEMTEDEFDLLDANIRIIKGAKS
ncbi:hypothetical protein ACR77J_16415 [Tissierella praeacuta]|uniref:hypothetical protein n=1 Tax=Tissierella praeacuta TaxID=43131 RepID=UPI003DA2866F